MLLKDKAIIVTGAGNGLGRGIAVVCAREGAQIVVADLNEDGARQTVKTIGEQAIACACDVRNEEDQARLVQTAVDTFGRIDGLVNNAGVNFDKDFLETTRDDWDRVIETDLAPVFFLTQKVCRVMLVQDPPGGSIVNIGSVHTKSVLPGSGPYDAAKWGVVGMSKSIAIELATRGIRVNVVSPGLCNTQIWADIQAAAPSVEACDAHWQAQIPSGKVIEPEEVGDLIAYLLSGRAPSMTGANLLIDGGMTSQLISREPYEPKPIEGT